MSVDITSEIKASFHVITTIVVKQIQGTLRCYEKKNKFSFLLYGNHNHGQTVLENTKKKHDIITALPSE